MNKATLNEPHHFRSQPMKSIRLIVKEVQSISIPSICLLVGSKSTVTQIQNLAISLHFLTHIKSRESTPIEHQKLTRQAARDQDLLKSIYVPSTQTEITMRSK